MASPERQQVETKQNILPQFPQDSNLQFQFFQTAHQHLVFSLMRKHLLTSSHKSQKVDHGQLNLQIVLKRIVIYKQLDRILTIFGYDRRDEAANLYFHEPLLCNQMGLHLRGGADQHSRSVQAMFRNR